MPGSELIGKEELKQINRLFKKSNVNLYRYGQNNFIATELEEKFAEYMGVNYAHLVSSGTAAIHSALAGCGIGKDDEVITAAYTFVAPIEAIADADCPIKLIFFAPNLSANSAFSDKNP